MVHLELLGPARAELRQTALRSGRHAPRNDHGVAPAVTGAARWAGRRLVDAGEQTGLWRVGTGNLLTARGTGSRSASMARLRIRRGRGPRARTRPSAARAHRRPQTGASKGQKGPVAHRGFRDTPHTHKPRDFTTRDDVEQKHWAPEPRSSPTLKVRPQRATPSAPKDRNAYGNIAIIWDMGDW